MPDAPAPLPQVVIVGGGFGGLAAAKALRRAPVRVTLVDRRNHHLFQPLLYQVATGALSPGDIAEPLRAIFRKHERTRVLLAEVARIDLAGRRVDLADGDALDYDYLVLAAGSRTSYFGHDEWMPLAPGLKSIEEALEMRRRIFIAFEAAERESDPAARRALLTFVVIGGGPTGVELAGALAEIARYTLKGDFRAIDPAEARIILIEAGPRVLPTFPECLSASAVRQLARLGVEVRGGVAVTAISAEAVTLATGEQIAAATVLWAAGVAASPLTATLGVPLDRAGRIPVEPDLRIPGHAAAYAIGDLAAIRQDGQPVPGVAPAALQAGRAAAANILRQARGEPPRPFRYVNRGNLAVIGRAAGVADFGWLRLDGLPAWLAWLLVHLWFLIGFANRLLVLFQWGWSYFTGERTARLITGDPTLPRRRATAARPESAPPAAAVRPADQPAHGGERDDRSDAH